MWQRVEEHEMLCTPMYLHWLDHLFHKVSVSQSTFYPWIVTTFQQQIRERTYLFSPQLKH